MEEQELDSKIEEFLKDKNFKNPFLQECITEFIKNHTELYGDVVSSDKLLERLYENLDKITFAGTKVDFDGELGIYKGRIADNQDLNEIIIFFNETDLDLSEKDKKFWDLYTEKDKQELQHKLEEKKAQIKSTIIHDLTHAAYTIKDKHGIGEKHIFSVSIKDNITGEYRQFGSNTNNVEAIVNYISSRIEGKNADEITTYKEETKAIYMLAEKMNEKDIINAAWNSDEEQLEQSYIDALGQDNEEGKQSYKNFQEGMKKLVINRNRKLSTLDEKQFNKEILSEIQNILDGKSPEKKSNAIKMKADNIQEKSDIEFEEKEKIPFLQRVAIFFEKNQILMNIPFVKKIVTKKLNILPSARNHIEKSEITPINSKREQFLNEQSNNGKYKKIGTLHNCEEEQNGENLKQKNENINER